MPGRPACGVVPAVAVRGGFGRESPLTRDTEAAGSGVTTRGGPQTATVLLSWRGLGHVSSKDPGRWPPAGPAHGAEGQGEANPTAARAGNPGTPGLTLHTPPPGLAQEQDLARGRARVLGRAPACGDSGWGRGRCSGLWVAGGLEPGGTQGEAASGGDACSPARSLGRRAQQNPRQPIPGALPLEPEPRAVPAISDSKPSGTRACCTCASAGCAPAGCALQGVVRGSLRPDAAPASKFSVSMGREPSR